MKLIIDNEDTFILFFNKYNEKIDLKNNIEETFKNIFLRLKKYYNINVYGFYNITVYANDNYGFILKAIKDKELDLFYNQIDMHIIIEKDSPFLYKIKDYFLIPNIVDKIKLYYYKNNFYVELKEIIKEIDLFNLIENSKIIYGDEVYIIKKNSKIIDCKRMNYMV